MIDPMALKCTVVAMVALGAGYIVLRIIEWGSKPVRPLKEKSARQKAQQKKRMRRVPQQMIDAPESHWRRPGGSEASQRPAMPIFGEGKPRHVRIDDTPHVIIPRQIIDPTPGHSSYRHNMPAVKIKPVDLESDQPPTPESKTRDVKSNKISKSNRTMPMKRIP